MKVGHFERRQGALQFMATGSAKSAVCAAPQYEQLAGPVRTDHQITVLVGVNETTGEQLRGGRQGMTFPWRQQQGPAHRLAAGLGMGRAAFANDSVRAAFASEVFRAAFANDSFRAAFASDGFKAVVLGETLIEKCVIRTQ